MGLFAPHGKRTLTAVCEEDCRLATISRDKVLELYFQHPKFGLFLIRLISGYVPADSGRNPADDAPLIGHPAVAEDPLEALDGAAGFTSLAEHPSTGPVFRNDA